MMKCTQRLAVKLSCAEKTNLGKKLFVVNEKDYISAVRNLMITMYYAHLSSIFQFLFVDNIS